MHCVPLRLEPNADLRASLETAAASSLSAFVVCGIGSLSNARLRLAGAESETVVPGNVEILSLSGTLTPDGAHLHMAVSDEQGRVTGGHVCYGNTVRTTAEVLLAQLPQWRLTREHDPLTGYKELVVRPVPLAPSSSASMQQYLYRIQPTRIAMLTEGPTQSEAETVRDHFAYLQGLLQAGTMLMAGRTTTGDERTFGIAIFMAESEATANEIMLNDPAVKRGVMRAELFPFRIAVWSSAAGIVEQTGA